MGGGTPTAEHSSSSGLFTAMVSSSGELELEIFGGSGVERIMCWLSCLHYDSNLKDSCGITEHSEVKALCTASSLVTGHTAVETGV